jgi:hypothetical protein
VHPVLIFVLFRELHLEHSTRKKEAYIGLPLRLLMQQIPMGLSLIDT